MNFEGEITLKSPMTKEDWDKLTDVEMEKTKFVTFTTPSGKECKYIPFDVLEELEKEISALAHDRKAPMYNIAIMHAVTIIHNKIKEMQ